MYAKVLVPMLTIQPYQYRSALGRNLLDRWFSDLAQVSNDWGLQYDDKEGLYTIEMDVAGYKREDIVIDAADGCVAVSATSKRRGSITQRYSVPDVDTSRVKATLANGVLTITAPILVEKLPKRIEISEE